VGWEPLAPLLPHSAASVPAQGRMKSSDLPGTNLPNLAQWLPAVGIIIGVPALNGRTVAVNTQLARM
jgi:hypothetical protein